MDRLWRWLRWSGALVVVLILYNIVTMEAGTRQLWQLMWNRLWSEERAFGVGVWDGIPNGADFSGLEPGDILLGHNPKVSWGEHSHAALYVGNGQILESFLHGGIHLEPVTRYHYYTRASILKVNLPAEVKQQAVAHGLSRIGRPFYLLAPRESGNWMYCTQLVWWSYKQAGIDLDPVGGFWVVPDRFLQSPFVTRIDPPQLRGGR